jgi:hypothetical protein
MAWVNPNGTFRTVANAARSVISAALDCSPELGDRPKALYLDGFTPVDFSPEARDIQKRGSLWKASIKYARLRGEETALAHWE